MYKQIRNSAVFRVMEEWAPLHLAYDWDNVGLQVGSFKSSTKKVLVTLDVLESVVDEAIEEKVDLIIAHHPMLFKPLKIIDFDDPKGRVIKKLIENNITVYASHTNLDIATGGVNDLLAERLDLTNLTNLIDVQTEKLIKLVVYVPETHADQVRDTLGVVGAGHIGNYSHTSFAAKGVGMFKPLEGTTPYTGEINRIESVQEVKIETILKEHEADFILESVIEVHPYEEVAYDLYPLKNKGEVHGMGRVGFLQKDMSLKDLVDHIKNSFDLSHVRVTGNLDKNIKKVAVLGGSGEGFITQAKQAEADVYITGDMTFHNAQDAMEMGLSVIDVGHYIEKVMKEATKSYLEEKFGNELSVITSEVSTDPFQTI